MTEKTENEVLEEKIAQSKEDVSVSEEKYLTFPLNKEEFGIDIQCITEIVGILSITEVPDMESYVKGVINLRGKIIPVIDVRRRFNIEEIEYNDRTCIIVVNLDDLVVGLIVDTVSEVVNIPINQIESSSVISSDSGASYIKGMGKIGDRVVILLDIEQLLEREKLAHIGNA
ncbi:chemotaxis protein CheW [candidate division KSB1 bacterium]